VIARGKIGLLLPCALLALAASKTPEQIDAGKLSCAQFAELGANVQKRILGFLQGYAHREVAEDKVGSVAIGAGLPRVLDACRADPNGPVAAKVQQLALGDDASAPGDARLTRPPTEISCRAYLKLSREDRRATVYWLDGYSRKADPGDANQSVVALRRNAEEFAETACGKRKQRLWWALKGGVRSVAAQPAS